MQICIICILLENKSAMMNRPWRYDVMLRIMMLFVLLTMMWCLPDNISEASSLVKRHHLPKANIIQKDLIVYTTNKVFLLVQRKGLAVCGGFALHTIRSATQTLRVSVPASRSSLKTVRRTVFLTLRPSRVQVPINLYKKRNHREVISLFWCRGRDLPWNSSGSICLKLSFITGNRLLLRELYYFSTNKSRRSLVYHQFRRNCISSTRSVASHQAAGGIIHGFAVMIYHRKAMDDIQPRRGWWYAKPAAWIKKEVTFGRQKLLLFWCRGRDLSPQRLSSIWTWW